MCTRCASVKLSLLVARRSNVCAGCEGVKVSVREREKESVRVKRGLGLVLGEYNAHNHKTRCQEVKELRGQVEVNKTSRSRKYLAHTRVHKRLKVHADLFLARKVPTRPS